MDPSQSAVGLAQVRFWSNVVAVALIALVLWRAWRPGTLRFRPWGIVVALALLVASDVWPAGLGRVQPGARGVVLRFGAPTGALEPEGLYYVWPLAERVVQVNTQVNTVRLDRAQGTSRDLEQVYVDLAVSFHVIPAGAVEVYRKFRADYAERVVYPAVADALKATVARYQAAELIADRESVQRALSAELGARLQRFGLGLDAVSTERFNFSFAYAQAAQAKVVAVQRSLQAKQDLQRVSFESQQNVIRAQSEAKALELQRKLPTRDVLRLRELELERHAIDKWDGHLPQTAAGVPFFGDLLGSRRD